MNFTFKGRTVGEGGGRRPYYVDLATVVEAKQNFTRTYSDISLELVLDIGKEWKPRLFVDVKFGKDKSGNVVDAGTAFKIGEVFSRLGVSVDISDEAPLDPASLAELVGKKVWYLRYISKNDKGEAKYRYLDAIQNGDWAGGKNSLERAFLKRWKEKSQPQAYDPTLVTAGSDETTLAEVATASTEVEALIGDPAEADVF